MAFMCYGHKKYGLIVRPNASSFTHFVHIKVNSMSGNACGVQRKMGAGPGLGTDATLQQTEVVLQQTVLVL